MTHLFQLQRDAVAEVEANFHTWHGRIAGSLTLELLDVERPGILDSRILRFRRTGHNARHAGAVCAASRRAKLRFCGSSSSCALSSRNRISCCDSSVQKLSRTVAAVRSECATRAHPPSTSAAFLASCHSSVAKGTCW